MGAESRLTRVIEFGRVGGGVFCACQRQLVILNSLKKEDKGRPDPSVKRRKRKKKRRPKKRRPQEINPFKLDTAPIKDVVADRRISRILPQDSNVIDVQCVKAGRQETPEEAFTGGFDVERLLGTSDFEEMMQKLDALDVDDGSDDDDDDPAENADSIVVDEGYDAMMKNPGLMFDVVHAYA